MAVLHKYREGGFYILRSYPIRLQGSLVDAKFTSLQVLQKAQAFFEEVGFHDGTRIEPLRPYAILVDGDFTSPAIQRRPPTVVDIPSNVIKVVMDLAEVKELASFFGAPEFLKCRCLLDYYRDFKARISSPEQLFNLPKAAAVICLINHFRSAQHRARIP